MKYSVAFLGLAALATATRLSRTAESSPSSRSLRRRQNVGINAQEFSDNGCKDNIFIFSRGSTEPGNLGLVVGPPVAEGLKAALGEDNVAVEGVEYGALLSTNFLPGGADLAGIQEMESLINQAASDCPDSNILVGGYSQGAAMTHRVVEDLDANVQDQIAGVVTFGDTQNQQDNGQINNFPADKTMVICNDGDLVCVGTLTILPPHLDYERRAGEAVDFLVGQVQGGAAKSRRR